MKRRFIPVCEPLLDGKEREYVLDAIESGWISSSGKYIAAFENKFAEYCGVKHGIAVCNGTTALHLGLVALGIGHGDEVLVPNFTMIASAFAVCYTGAVPIFIDAEPDTWNIDVNKIEGKITKKTKAIMPVHIYGHPCDMNPINALAQKYGLKIIEDAAEVHGSEYYGNKCGSLGDVAAFSFFANKIATTGEGGMVVTNDDEIARRCRYHKNLCFPLTGIRNYQHSDIGFNYRMSNLHAAIGLAQVERLDFYVARRRSNHALYRKYLHDTSGILFQAEKQWAKNVFWMNGIVVDSMLFGMTRDELALSLKEHEIDTRPFFVGMHKQEALLKYGCLPDKNYSTTEWLTENGLYLPSSSNLTEDDILWICENINSLKRTS